MKIKILRSPFLEGLKTVQNVVASKTSLPVLQNVLLRAQGSTLEMTTSDLDMTVRTVVDCEVMEGGESTLPVKLLFSTMSKAAEGPVEIDIDENEQATLLAGSAKFNMTGLKASEFPQLPGFEDAKVLEVENISLKEMLRKTAFAAATDDTRRPLLGVLLRFREGKFTMAATDGRRLAMVEKEMEISPEAETEIVLPSRAAQELLRALGGEGMVEIDIKNNQACFKFGKTAIYSKLIDEVYPNFEQVIPRNHPECVTVDRVALIEALERASIVSVAASISTHFVFENGVLSVSASSIEIGAAKDQLPIKYSGEKIEINFNPVYILDALKSIDDDEVKIELKDGYCPGVIRCSIPYLYVIMPLRIG